MKIRATLAALTVAALPLAASANTATSQSIVSMTIQGSSCSITSSQNASFGTLSNPITSVQYTSSQVYISCGSSSPAISIAFSDAANSGTYNFTMTNSTTTSATQLYQICDYQQFTGTTCPNGYEYKNTTSDSHALSSMGTQNYNFATYFTPANGGTNLASGTYYDTLTETITF